MILVSTIICCVACTLLLLAERKNIDTLKWISKFIASTCFVVVAFIANDEHNHFTNWMKTAFIWCFIGDILLIRSENKRVFLFGLISFAIAHLCFVVAFLWKGEIGILFILTAFSASVLMFGSYIWLKPNLESVYKVEVPFYILIIGTMIAVSGFIGAVNKSIIIGAILFGLSDIFVAREAFVESGFRNKIFGLPLYYLAQIILAMSLVTKI